MINCKGLTNIPKERLALALGNFDGLHLGHMEVLNSAIKNGSGLTPAVVTFDPHPRKILQGCAPSAILTNESKITFLENLGVKYQIILDFKKIHNMNPEEFFKKLTSSLSVGMICCGYNYRFGKNGSGNTDLLKSLCNTSGIALVVAPPVMVGDQLASSTAIRKFIEDGDMERAATMLGRNFSVNLEVVSGDKRGRTIGFPTINQILPPNLVKPKFGVYASRAFVDGKWHLAVTNIGIRPTYLAETPLFETYITDYSGDLYGKNIKIELLSFIRGEVKFLSIEDLKDAISSDLQRTKNLSINKI